MSTRRLAQLTGAVVVVWTMVAGPFAQVAQEAGGRVDTPARTAALAEAGVTPAEIIAAFSEALGEADRGRAKLDHAELEKTFASVLGRINALPRRSCGLSVPWNKYTSRFADILARVGDAPGRAVTAERNHAMAGLQELDRFVTIAARYSADVCSDDRELAALKRQTQGYREDARARLGRVTDGICRGMTDRATLTAVVNRHRPAHEPVQRIYDAVSVELLDEIGRLKRSGRLCSAPARSVLQRLPAIVVENYSPYRDPVGIKTVENAGIRRQLERRLDERGRNWLKMYTVPAVGVPAGHDLSLGRPRRGHAARRPRLRQDGRRSRSRPLSLSPPGILDPCVALEQLLASRLPARENFLASKLFRSDPASSNVQWLVSASG